jgi:hypothetical protein
MISGSLSVDSGSSAKAHRYWKAGFAGFVSAGLGFTIWLSGRPDVISFPPSPEFLAIERTPRKPKPLNDGPALTLSLERTQASVTNTISTAMLFVRKSPPPCEHGNHLTFWFRKPQLRDGLEEHASWYAINMHADNFSKITQQLHLSSVEVRVLHRQLSKETLSGPGNTEREQFRDEAYAIVADPRIPREWLLAEPGIDRKTRAILLAAYPEFFRAKQ